MSKTYALGVAPQWAHASKGGPQVVVLDSGEAVPAASGYNEGDELRPHPDDIDETLLECVDVSGTKYWMGTGRNHGIVVGTEVVQYTVTTTIYTDVPHNPAAAGMYLVGISVTAKDQVGSAANYFTVAYKYNNAQMAILSWQNLSTDRRRQYAAIGSVVAQPAAPSTWTSAANIPQWVLTENGASTFYPYGLIDLAYRYTYA